MNKITLLIILITSGLCLQAQESLNMIQTSNWDVDSLPEHSLGTYNDIWGYVDSEGKEYAIMGSGAFVHFFDVTDPADPVEIAAIPGGEVTVWRDIKTYGNYAYSVSDATEEGLMIFDMSYLPDSVVLVNQTDEFFENAHNIFIDETHGRLYAVGTNVQGSDIIVLDIASDSTDPILLASLPLDPGEDIHDLYVRDNIVYASHGYENLFVIWDFTNPSTPEYIASFESNGNTAIFAEEVPTGLPMGLLDISDMENDNLELYTYFKFPLLAPEFEDATPHNPYILGDLVITSYYEDGVMVFDISDPANPFLSAYYDTHPQNSEYNGYRGCWGVYPFLPSGNILASDMQNGLSVLQFDYSVSTGDLPENIENFQIFPNPSNGLINLQLESSEAVDIEISILSLAGQVLNAENTNIHGVVNKELDISYLNAGMYFVKVSSGNQFSVQKIVKN